MKNAICCLKHFNVSVNCYVVGNGLIMKLLSEFMTTLVVGTVFSVCIIQNETCCSNAIYVATAGVAYCYCCMHCGELAGGFIRQIG
jgi:TPP-dependent trihydroxycyclohexane-1,2-dione (THcHDO) dehydratase